MLAGVVISLPAWPRPPAETVTSAKEAWLSGAGVAVWAEAMPAKAQADKVAQARATGVGRAWRRPAK
ncbi:hypothetical protein D3C78_1519190 [compost metagenome]